jgi:hypothetical protein
MIITEKTTAMCFHTMQKRIPLQPQVKFDSMDIAYKLLETNFLGMGIYENMKWCVHVKYKLS